VKLNRLNWFQWGSDVIASANTRHLILNISTMESLHWKTKDTVQ
jgi:hypothetical protein